MIYSISCSPTIELERSFKIFSEDKSELDSYDEISDGDDFQELNPEDLATDRGWLYLCRHCECQTRIRTTAPYCRLCGFAQKTLSNNKGI